jgi:hypothetical protein
MSDRHEGPSSTLDDEFERLGRKAGAELRTSPPPDGPRMIERTSNRRRATITTIACTATVAVIVTVLVVARREPQPQQDNHPVATTSPSPTPTSLVAGTWREVPDSPLALKFPSSATWTGDEAVMLGRNDIGSSTLSAVAYDVRRDQWRQLADPPAALNAESFPWESRLTSWTGSEVLVSTSQGEVFAYDPVRNMWNERSSADESMGLASLDSRIAVSARGVLARSSQGWWWYESSTDRWEALPSPALGVDFSMVDELDGDTMVATQIEDSTITSAVLDIDTRTWQNGPSVTLESPRFDAQCDATDGRVVCLADGYSAATGVVIDPLVGSVGTFTLGSHSNSLTLWGIPWFTHAWKLLSPRSATWEDLPGLGEIDGFTAAVWTGTEIVFFGGNNAESGQHFGTTAAYAPRELPSQ